MATPRNLPRRLRAAIKTAQERLDRISRETPNEHRRIGAAFHRIRSLQTALKLAESDAAYARVMAGVAAAVIEQEAIR